MEILKTSVKGVYVIYIYIFFLILFVFPFVAHHVYYVEHSMIVVFHIPRILFTSSIIFHKSARKEEN